MSKKPNLAGLLADTAGSTRKKASLAAAGNDDAGGHAGTRTRLIRRRSVGRVQPNCRGNGIGMIRIAAGRARWHSGRLALRLCIVQKDPHEDHSYLPRHRRLGAAAGPGRRHGRGADHLDDVELGRADPPVDT